MTCYPIGLLRYVAMGPEIDVYLENIDGTLALFGGHSIVHGGRKHMLEGHTGDDLIVIEFPDRESAEGWYSSAASQKIDARIRELCDWRPNPLPSGLRNGA